MIILGSIADVDDVEFIPVFTLDGETLYPRQCYHAMFIGQALGIARIVSHNIRVLPFFAAIKFCQSRY